MLKYFPADPLLNDVFQKETRKFLSKISGGILEKRQRLFCAPLFSSIIDQDVCWGPGDRESSQVGSGDRNKTCEYHPNLKDHRIEERIEFKNAVRRLFSVDSTQNTCGDSVLLACDEPQICIPVTERPYSIVSRSLHSRTQ